MGEEKEEKQEEEKPTDDNLNEGDKLESGSPLEQIRTERERAEKAVEEMKLERMKLENERAAALVHGRTDAGIQPEKPKELSDEEYANKALNGELTFTS